MESKKVLITGGCGYIGSHLVYKLQSRGHQVYICDLKHTEPFDICKVTEIPDMDAIVNLAAVSNVPDAEADPERAWDTNFFGTRNMIELAADKGIPFIHADTAMSSFADKSVYAETKAAARKLVCDYDKGINMTLYNVAGASFTGLIGENHEPETHFIPNLVNAMITGEPFRLEKNAIGIKRDFVHVDDVCQAFLLAVKDPFRGSYEVGTGNETCLQRVVEIAQRYSDKLKIEHFESGRFEPHDYFKEKGYTSAKFAAKESHYYPGWSPIWDVYYMIESQYCYKTGGKPLKLVQK
jgi:UDP-glucose 4-epimerase